jgi:hypothetical protein
VVGSKADDLALQKRKEKKTRNPRKWKPDGIWQNLLRKAMAQKGPSYQ